MIELELNQNIKIGEGDYLSESHNQFFLRLLLITNVRIKYFTFIVLI